MESKQEPSEEGWYKSKKVKYSSKINISKECWFCLRVREELT